MNFKLTTAVLLAFFAAALNAAVIFQDDFDNQPSDWDVGDGALTTPPGQEGTWGIWNRNPCSVVCPGVCGDLPPQADDWLKFIDPTGGKDGTQGVRFVIKSGCTTADYPASTDYIPLFTTYKEMYFGFHLKVDTAWKADQASFCKFPIWVSLGTGEPVGRIWNQDSVMTRPGNGPWEFYHINATPGGFQPTGIIQNEIIDDAWHWIEYHVKLNTSDGSADGEYEVWLDGVLQSSYTGLTFWPGNNSEWLYKFRIELGNCSGAVTSWSNTDWAGYTFDNFKASTTYIGPPDSSPYPVPTGFSIRN